MNDRFSFRAWDKEKGQMIGVLTLDFLFEDENGIRAEGYCDCNGGLTQDHESHKHNIFPENLVLMQCTGHRDKSDRLIFEGDVIKHYNEVNPKFGYNLCVIEWDEELTGFRRTGVSEGHHFGHQYKTFEKDEIIGNIYENPELLPKPTQP